MSFENRVALVTGGTGALGSTVVLDLISSGARVAAPYRSQEEFDNLKRQAGGRGENLIGMKADLTCRRTLGKD
jgi:NAD(P)-dependent dehydrogenase (short-subunit alcohol dehydrogenase family)